MEGINIYYSLKYKKYIEFFKGLVYNDIKKLIYMDETLGREP